MKSFNVEILASNEVHLKAGTELNASPNLDIHIGIAQTLNDCISDTTVLNHRVAKPQEHKQKPLKTNVANIKQNNVNASYLEPLTSVITITPNPAINSVSINTYYDNEKTEIRTVAIFNTVGQVVYEKELRNTNAEIDISSLTKGAYIIKCTDTNNNTTYHNFIKQ